jgi:hypothetical protein
VCCLALKNKGEPLKTSNILWDETYVSEIFRDCKPGDRLVQLPFGLSQPVRMYSLTFLPVLLFCFVMWAQPYVPVEELMRDPISVAELSEDCCHIHYGFVSNVGVLLWAATAAVLLFSALVVGLQKQSKQVVRFHLFAGTLTALLCVDDFFLVHDIVLPTFGIPEKAAYAAYGLLTLAYFQQSWRQILEMRPLMLFISFLCLGGSAFIDSFMNLDSVLRLFVEDGLKLIGIVAWLSFHLEASLGFVAYGAATGHTAPALRLRA